MLLRSNWPSDIDYTIRSVEIAGRAILVPLIVAASAEAATSDGRNASWAPNSPKAYHSYAAEARVIGLQSEQEVEE
jgi:hypothetical protein